VDRVTELESKGYAGSYGQAVIKAVKSWLSFNNITLGERRINLTDADDTPTLRERKAPELGHDVVSAGKVLWAYRLLWIVNRLGSHGLSLPSVS